ncbi:lipoprotein-releasing ABC transporter permease subunit [Luminiphilus sp.]|nr:lipoprotein-releasing ABC transporter permease subunit [Luminiphilus sp.]
MSFTRDMMIRYTFTGRRQGFTKLISRASMLGMVLGVASLITVLSVMNGFASELRDRILSLVPHAVVTSSEGSLIQWQELSTQLQTAPSVQSVAPFIEDVALLQSRSRRVGSQITGVDLAAQRGVSDLHRRIIAGDLTRLESEPFTIALGSTLAGQLGAITGDVIEVVLPTLSVTPLGVFPRVRKLMIVAEFEVGSSIDAVQSYVGLETAARLFARRGIDGLQIDLGSPDNVSEAVPALRQMLHNGANPHLTVEDWRDSQGSLFAAVKMEKIMVGILLLAVIAVAAFNIISTLTMSVTEKARDIAVLRVMGFTSLGVMGLFLGHGLLIGSVGITIGAILGVCLAIWISDIASLVEGLTGMQLFDPSVYYIGRLPSELQWGDVVITVCLALLLSVMATVYPAWRASRISPVEVLNNG